MKLADLQARLGRNVSLSVSQWAFAWLLGEARRQSNRDRAQTSDRGALGNQAVDLHGALGELLLFGIVRDLGDPAALEYIRQHLYVADGGRSVAGPDASFIESDASVGIDVKTFDCDPKKRFFAINDNKHAQLYGQCVGYAGLICPAFAQRACLTRIIPYDDVSTWERKILRANGTASRNLRIEDAMARYCAEPYDIAESRNTTYPRRLVIDQALQAGSGSAPDRLIRLIPEIEPVVLEICRSRPSGSP